MTTTYPTPQRADELLFLGVRCRILVDPEITGDPYGLVDMVEVPPGDMPPLHVHHGHDEGFLLLDGELTLFLPGREVRLRAGEFVLAPRGVPHTYRVGDAPARWLVIGNPGGFEQFVREVAGLGEVSPEALTATGARHDIEILGPPGERP
jgi:quercetin dioxygenase-like cupin family protein